MMDVERRPVSRIWNEAMPIGILPTDAYTAIRKWCRANTSIVTQRGDHYGNAALALVKALPPATKASKVEIWAVFLEVLYGNLEWAFQHVDGEYKIAAYVFAALEAANRQPVMKEEEQNDLRTNSALWPLLFENTHRK